MPLVDGWFVPRPGHGPLAVFATWFHAWHFARTHSWHDAERIVVDRVAAVRSTVQSMQWTPHPAYTNDALGCWRLPNGAPCTVIEAENMPKGKVLVDCFYVLETDVTERQT
jgi:hypothetical protein